MLNHVQSSNQISESIWWWYYANSPLKIAQFDVSDCWRLYHLPLYGVWSMCLHVRAAWWALLIAWHGMGHRRPSSLYSMAQYSTVHVYKVTLHLEWLPVDSGPVPGVLAPTPATPSSEASWWTRCSPLHYHKNCKILCFEKVSSNQENRSLFYFFLLISMELIWESKTN